MGGVTATHLMIQKKKAWPMTGDLDEDELYARGIKPKN